LTLEGAAESLTLVGFTDTTLSVLEISVGFRDAAMIGAFDGCCAYIKICVNDVIKEEVG
jgi:hypothetical protein